MHLRAFVNTLTLIQTGQSASSTLKRVQAFRVMLSSDLFCFEGEHRKKGGLTHDCIQGRRFRFDHSSMSVAPHLSAPFVSAYYRVEARR